MIEMNFELFKELVIFCKQQDVESVRIDDVMVAFRKPPISYQLEQTPPLTEAEQARQNAIDDDRLTFMSSI